MLFSLFKDFQNRKQTAHKCSFMKENITEIIKKNK